jgi:hypothetical protein
MPRVGFDHLAPAFERAKTVHALDRAATVIGTAILLKFLITVIEILQLLLLQLNRYSTSTELLTLSLNNLRTSQYLAQRQNEY